MRSWIRRTVFGREGARVHNPFTTHIPVLVALGRSLCVKRVLELGCGEFSTRTFLNTTAFPELEHLRSLETDAAWLERMANATRADPRIVMTHVPTSMARALIDVPLGDFDLIFVDDSTETRHRAETIRAVARSAGSNAVVVIHDFETPEYQAAATAFRERFIFTALTPQTGVAWNGTRLSRFRLRLLNRALRLASLFIEPADVQRWTALFTALA